ncbi:MAG: hypothetical protein WBM13_01495 [Bacteroidia bacterium]
MKTLLKILFFTVWLCFAAQSIVAQSHAYVDVAQVFSKFKFSSTTNNEAPGSGYSTITTTSFGFGYQYANKNGVLLGGGLNIRKAGSALVVNKINYAWNLQYADVKFTIGYQYNKYRIRPHVIVSPYFSYLLNASQSVGLNYYDLKASKSLKSSDFGLFFTPGINVDLSRYFSIYIDYNYIFGLNNIETGEGQFLYNRAFALSGGLLFNLSAIKTKETPTVVHDTIIQTQIAQNKVTVYDTIYVSSKTNTIEKQNDQSALINQDLKNNQSPVEKNTILKNDTALVSVNQNNTGENKLNIANQSSNKSNENEYNPVTTSNNTNNNVAVKQIIKNDTIKNTSSNVVENKLTTTQESSNQTYKLTEQELKGISKVAVSKNIMFKIQLVALKNELSGNNQLFKEVPGGIKKEKGDDGFYRYYTGTYKTYEKAQEELVKIKNSSTAKDAFIVAFKDGKKITVADAKNIIK